MNKKGEALYTAICLSNNSLSQEFPTEEEAWEFIFSSMCQHCQKERESALAGNLYSNTGEDWQNSLYPACSAEWDVVKTDELNKCESLEDLLSLSFGPPIYPEKSNDSVSC